MSDMQTELISQREQTRRGQTPPPTNPNNTNNMTPEAVQTLIDQALMRNSGGGDGSHIRDNNIPAYTNRFQELALICTKFISNETEKVDKYISGLPDNIYGNVKSLKPNTLDETIELANDLMDQKLLITLSFPSHKDHKKYK
nr:reverse transcriptase domain-containing protein [Tanacetum cinerariifolium]